jgi:malate dehydrogenase
MQKSSPTLGLIGIGQIGSALARQAASRYNLLLLDQNADMAEGKALDLAQSLSKTQGVKAVKHFKDLEAADVLIITAGFPRMSDTEGREALLARNLAVFRDIREGIKAHCSKALVIVVTNPLDAMTWALQHLTELPKTHVVGMAGLLDSLRFRFFLGRALNVPPATIQTMVLGGHGDLMVPLISHTSIEGIPLSWFLKTGRLSESDLQAVIQKTRRGGGTIAKLLQKGSAFEAPAACALEMADAYFSNTPTLLPAATFLEGAYGEKNLCMGVPLMLGRGGVEEILELSLNPEEEEAFKASARSTRSLIREAHDLLEAS